MPPEWHHQARELRAEGFTEAAIGRALGRTQGAVHKALNPELAKAHARKDNQRRRAAKREWDRAHAAERNERLKRQTAERRLAEGIVEPEPEPGKIWIRDRRGRVKGHVLVDIEDWHRFRHMRFHYAAEGGYAQTSIGDRREYLHRLVVGTVPDGLEVDHINRNPFDNRRANLRVVTHRENCLNRGGRFEKASDALAKSSS